MTADGCLQHSGHEAVHPDMPLQRRHGVVRFKNGAEESLPRVVWRRNDGGPHPGSKPLCNAVAGGVAVGEFCERGFRDKRSRDVRGYREVTVEGRNRGLGDKKVDLA